MQDRNYYVDTSGKISFSMSTDTVNYLLKTMTGDPKVSSNEDFDVNLTANVNGVLVETGKTKLSNMTRVQPQGFVGRLEDLDSLGEQIENNNSMFKVSKV